MSLPAVSVLLPVRNAARFLRPAVASVLAQTLPDFECLILDDGSTDGTARELRHLAGSDRRVRVVSRENRGLVPTLNELIARARGRYLARMDGDDLCAPHRLASQVRFLKENESCVAVGSAVDFIDPAGRRLKTMRVPLTHAGILAELLDGNGGAMIHPSVMFRATAMTAVAGYAPAFADYGEDWDLFLRLSTRGLLANLPDVLLRYRMHPHSYNHTRREDQIGRYLAAVNTARRQNGLAVLAALPGAPAGRTLAAVHRLWAEWAIEGAEHRTARLQAFTALVHAPLNRASWRFLRYAAGLRAPAASA
jgi:glycosyltransferase involved in cell wall biosynthesis